MTTSLLSDAFAHHVWATERLIDACAALTPEQLTAPAPGTFGSIIDTLQHLVAADSWYLSLYDNATEQIDEEAETSLAELRSVMASNGTAWTALLAGEVDPDKDVVQLGDTGWEFHAAIGLRLAQVVHHGTDHRSQVCTALSSLGLTPPAIDLWDYGEATGRTREVPAPAP
jgi:uncharacterized damage-inducible protein DinB